MAGKLVIFSAPSGAGKTTIVKHLVNTGRYDLEFSVSACCRQKRAGEIDGKDYYFLSVKDFLSKIKKGEFLEWQEVYEGHLYGTLKSEVERITSINKNVVFDVDVEGGLNLKKEYGENALAVFVMPPSIEHLEQRLQARSTETAENIAKRMAKAGKELEAAKAFDVILFNDNLENALAEAEKIVENYLTQKLIS
ncbi:MAG: guanylate kinase [Bacteroidetes bacterium]|nr:guanylate kinase [Bacteroidota bacterium]